MRIPQMLLQTAASDASVADIEDFFEWVEEVGAAEASSFVVNLRKQASMFDKRSRSDMIKSSKIINNIYSNQAYSDNPHASMIDAVERLLLKESGLTKRQAVHAIVEGLEAININSDLLPQPNKVSFRSWLARIGENVTDSQVLHIASKIRNEVVHGKRSRSDWPL